jgi:hypothetical protein
MAVPWPTCRHPAVKFRLPRPEASGRGRGDFAFANKPPLWSGRLALQLLSYEDSESMDNHDSKIVDAGSVD